MDNRYYFESVTNNQVILDKNETGHLSKVRRASVGDIITGFCGDGYDYTLKIQEISKTTTCSVENKIINKSTNTTDITMFLATLKNDALVESVDILTQLNVKHLIVFDAKYSVASIDDDKINKLKLKSIQSCKQCERADIMEISKLKFNDMVKSLSGYDLVLFAYEDSTNAFVDMQTLNQYKNKKVAVIVGCEGGFNAEEVEVLSKIAKTVSLGKTILRAPVAVCAITSAVMSGLGEWSSI